MTVNDYIGLEYEDGGRGPDKYDCWGLVRSVRHEVFGRSLLPSFGTIRPTMCIEFTRSCNEVCNGLEKCGPEPGALVGIFRGRVCTHVGIMVEVGGVLGVLDTTSKTNSRWMCFSDFQRRYMKVIYYR